MKRMKYLKVLCFTTALSLSISLVPMTSVRAQSLDAVIASNELSHSDEQIEPHPAVEDNSGTEDSGSVGLEDNSGIVVSEESNGQMVLEETGGQLVPILEMDSTGLEDSSSESSGLFITIEETTTNQGVDGTGQVDGSGGLSGQEQTTSGQVQNPTPVSSSPMSAEEFSSLLSSSTVTPDTTSHLSTTVTSLIKRAASTLTTILCVFITAFLTVRVLLDLLFLALPFTESIATHFGFGAENPTNPQGALGNSSTIGLNNSLPGGNRMSLPPQSPSPNPTPQSSSSKRFTLISDEVLRARQSPHPYKTYCHDAIIILTVTPMLLVLTVSGVFNHLGLLFGDVIVNLLNSLGGLL